MQIQSSFFLKPFDYGPRLTIFLSQCSSNLMSFFSHFPKLRIILRKLVSYGQSLTLNSEYLQTKRAVEINLLYSLLLLIIMEKFHQLNTSNNTKLQKTFEQQQQILFISEGRLKYPEKDQLNGIKWIMDQDNYTDIIGNFQKDQCENACIYSLHQSTINNIRICTTQQRQVLMGGSDIQQTKQQILLYKGGYKGYQRYGFGTLFYNQQGNDYEQWGFWNGTKQKGKFIKENYAQQSQYSIIQYQESKWKEVKFTKTNVQIIKLDIDSQNGINSFENINQQQYKRQIQLIELFKKQLIAKHQQQIYVAPLRLYPISYNKYDQNDLQNIQKLSYDQCELYLQYIFHQRESQRFKKTAIMGLCIIDIYNRLKQKEANTHKYNKQIKRMMKKYQRPFDLLGGFWEMIIIPLVLTEINDHYSFAVVNIPEMRCIYYDSLHQPNTNDYDQLIKQLLQREAEKSNISCKKLVESMQFTISKDFPRQIDNFSCGFYMLQGISQILQQGRVNFTNKEFSLVKKKIKRKLKEIKR